VIPANPATQGVRRGVRSWQAGPVLSAAGDQAPAGPSGGGTAGGARVRPEPSPDEPRPVAWARGLGAIQEAERLGSWRVGSEHLLLATLLDPVVRRLLFEAGVDVGGLQRRIGRPLRTGIGAAPGTLPRTDEMALSDGAVRLLAALEERTRTDPALAGWVRPDHTTDPQGRSVVRRHLLVTLLRDAEPGAARGLLDEHGVDTHADWLTERLVGRA
jgi:hypothetical protein